MAQLAEQILEIYGKDGAYLDYDLLQAEAIREQEYFAFVNEMHHRLLLKTVRPLYRQLRLSRNLETIPGVGQDGAAVYLSFIGNPKRFHGLRELRGWCGMVPNSKQSANSQASGLKITQAGAGLIKMPISMPMQLANMIHRSRRFTMTKWSIVANIMCKPSALAALTSLTALGWCCAKIVPTNFRM